MRLLSRCNSCLFLGVISIFLFAGCSSKNVNSDYNKFYKDTKNSNINNSPQMHKYTMRPYSVFGITYYPAVAPMGERTEGIASWYGPNFHSKKTSNGEIYNMHDMTAAHKTLPMNTVVKVDNLENGRTIIVRINDRGPFVAGRIIDLSNKAAHQIDMVRKGTAKVRVTVLGYNGVLENSNAPAVETVAAPQVTKEEKIEVFEAIEIQEENVVTTTTPISTNIGTPIAVTPSVTKSSNTTSSSKIGIQVGAFSKLEGANKVKSEYQKRFPSKMVEYVNQNGLYKVIIKGFSSYDDAQIFKSNNGLNNSVIIK